MADGPGETLMPADPLGGVPLPRLCPAGADEGESECVNAGDDEESRSASEVVQENLLLLHLPQPLCRLLILLHLPLSFLSPCLSPCLAPSLWLVSLSPSPRSWHALCWEECGQGWDIVQREGLELGGVGVDKTGAYLEMWSVEKGDEEMMLLEVEEVGEEVEGEQQGLLVSPRLR